MIENDSNFWDNLENDEDRILKYREDGDYGVHLDPEQIEFLESFQSLPVVPEISIGDVVNGKITQINNKHIVIDVNYKDSVYVDIKANDAKLTQNLEKDEVIDVMITSVSEKPFEIKGSITELIKIDVANKLRNLYIEKEALEATVKELIPAGFMLEIEMNNITLTAFMPNTLAGANRLTPEQSQELVGQTLPVMLETLQQEKGVYVVSRKKYLKSLIPAEIEKLEKEKVYTGIVTGSKDFGVFVEFNTCLTGMIHKVNINEEWQTKMDQIIPGMEIDFYVQDVLKGDRLILTQNPNAETLWDTIRVNQIKTGKIINVKDFGALVSLDSQTMGLIQNTYIKKSGRDLKKGDTVEVKVVSVIKDERKIYLAFPENK